MPDDLQPGEAVFAAAGTYGHSGAVIVLYRYPSRSG